MHPIRKQRLMIVLFVVIGVSSAVGLLLYGMDQNINFFFTPAQVAKGEAPIGKPIRVGGIVVDGSVVREKGELAVVFDLTDYEGTISVKYNKLLPDLFREGQGIIANGVLDQNGYIIATEVLAKHDENYMPPEIADSLKEKGTVPVTKHYQTSDDANNE